MEFFFKTVGSAVHLYRNTGLLNEDLGELSKTITGKLKTNKIFGENFELQDISVPFAKGQRYSISSTKGLRGTLQKRLLSDRYVLE